VPKEPANRRGPRGGGGSKQSRGYRLDPKQPPSPASSTSATGAPASGTDHTVYAKRDWQGDETGLFVSPSSGGPNLATETQMSWTQQAGVLWPMAPTPSSKSLGRPLDRPDSRQGRHTGLAETDYHAVERHRTANSSSVVTSHRRTAHAMPT
jgi:hypothetical protein